MSVFSWAAHALGACVEGDCEEGRIYMAELSAYFNALPSAQQAAFQPSVNSIQAAWNDLGATWYPFAPACCEAAAIGAQAHALVQQMQQVSGAPAPSSVTDPTHTVVDTLATAADQAAQAAGDTITGLLSAAKWLIFVGAIGVGGFVLYEGVTAVRHGRKVLVNGPSRRRLR